MESPHSQDTNHGEERTSSKGETFEPTALQDFLRSTLRHDTLKEQVDRRLHDHLAADEQSTSEVATDLRAIIEDTLSAATDLDWSLLASDLLAESEATPAQP